jgi:hypothetical protein
VAGTLKLLGIKPTDKGVAVTDGTRIGELKVHKKKPLVAMGATAATVAQVVADTAEGELLAEGEGGDEDDAEDPAGADVDHAAVPANVAKLQRRVDKYEIKVLNKPREGKKLLVRQQIGHSSRV